MLSNVVLNSSVSVDCIIFGFDGTGLKVLLIKRNPDTDQYKLPGSMIYENEDVETASSRVLYELTSLRGVAMKPLNIFSQPDRISSEDLEWMHKTYGIDTQRIITVAYYAFLKLTPELTRSIQKAGKASWHDTYNVKKLAFDHKQILVSALDNLYKQFVYTPIVFEFLPTKFTIRQVQDAYQKIFDIEIDNRNFRKKLLSYPFLTPTGEWERGVKHKPAQLYVFDSNKYERVTKKLKKATVIQW